MSLALMRRTTQLAQVVGLAERLEQTEVDGEVVEEIIEDAHRIRDLERALAAQREIIVDLARRIDALERPRKKGD